MHKYEKKRSFNAQTIPLSEVWRVRGNPAMLVALNIMRGVFGRFMRGIHGWYVRGGNKSGYAFGTDDSSQQFPLPPYVSRLFLLHNLAQHHVIRFDMSVNWGNCCKYFLTRVICNKLCVFTLQHQFSSPCSGNIWLTLAKKDMDQK